jgi:hypothetical protein
MWIPRRISTTFQAANQQLYQTRQPAFSSFG